MDSNFTIPGFNADYVFNSENMYPDYSNMCSNSPYYHDYVKYYSGFYQPYSPVQPTVDPNSSYQYANSPAHLWTSPTPQYPISSSNYFLTPTPSTSPQSQSTELPNKKCSHCSSTETCQWRNIRSKDGILCNACFTYKRKYKELRPVDAIQKYKNRGGNGLKSTH